MKKTITAFFVALTAIFVSLAFTACKSNAVRYDLVDVEFANLTVNHYDYNYIEFDFGNGIYELKNKVKMNGIVTRQKGHFWVDADNYVTITNDDIPAQNYLLCPNEVIYLKDEELVVSGSIAGYGEVSMTFRK